MNQRMHNLQQPGKVLHCGGGGPRGAGSSPQLRPTFVSTGAFRGVCKKIDHFPEDADYEQDTAEYLLREFPLLGSPLEGVRAALQLPGCL